MDLSSGQDQRHHALTFCPDHSVGADHFGRVGHVMLTDEADSVSIVSQFPHGPNGTSAARGPNVTLEYDETYTAERGEVSVIFEYEVSADRKDAFDAMANNHTRRPTWCWNPTAPYETHCARAAYECLRAGGAKIDPTNYYLIGDGERRQIVPNTLWRLLEYAKVKVIVQNRRRNIPEARIKKLEEADLYPTE
jgi:hypothetical protein